MPLRAFILIILVTGVASAQQSPDTSAASDRRPNTSIILSSQPDSATVVLDSTVVGVTPRTIEGAPYGTHIVRLELSGHAPFIDTVHLRFGTVYRASPRLLRTGTALVTSDPPGVPAYLADTLIGVTPVELSGLRPGRVSIRIEDPIYKPFRSFIFIPEGDTARVALRLDRRFVALSAQLHAPNAEIFVDDVLAGTGSLVNFPADIGPRRITVKDGSSGRSVSTVVRCIRDPIHLRSRDDAWQWWPVMASAVLPGVGQSLHGEVKEGRMIAAGFVTLAGVSYLLHRFTERRLDEYESARRAYLDYPGSSVTELVRLRNEARNLHDKALTASRVRVVPIVATVLLYAYNLADVVLYHSRGLDIEVGFPTPVGPGAETGVEASLRIPLNP